MTRHRDTAELFVARNTARDVNQLARQMARTDERRAASQFHHRQDIGLVRPLKPAEILARFGGGRLRPDQERQPAAPEAAQTRKATPAPSRAGETKGAFTAGARGHTGRKPGAVTAGLAASAVAALASLLKMFDIAPAARPSPEQQERNQRAAAERADAADERQKKDDALDSINQENQRQAQYDRFTGRPLDTHNGPTQEPGRSRGRSRSR